LPAIKVMVEGEEVDAHWPGTILIVELDSWEWHRTRGAFERDRVARAQPRRSMFPRRALGSERRE
jgi:hypothetical protein